MKIYLVDGLHKKETLQLEQLKKHSTLKMPSVYYIHDKDSVINMDAIIMEFLEGSNAGYVIKFNPKLKKSIVTSVIANLLAFHSTINPEGFGEIDDIKFTKDWEELYKKRATAILDNGRELVKNGKLPLFIVDTMKAALDKFDIIFAEKVTKASLIHGDYNMFNLLYDKTNKKITGCIDPFHCMWADRELDLYQISNTPNGKFYKLLKYYKKATPLSKNFEIKLSFYRLFSEINHLYDSGVDFKIHKYMKYAKELSKKLKKLK